MSLLEKIKKYQSDTWKISLEGKNPGFEDDISFDLKNIEEGLVIPHDVMELIFKQMRDFPHYDIGENIKNVVNPKGEKLDLNSFALLGIQSKESDEKITLLLEASNETFFPRAAYPHAILEKYKDKEQWLELFKQIAEKPDLWDHVVLIIPVIPFYFALYEGKNKGPADDRELLFYSFTEKYARDKRIVPLSVLFDLIWQCTTLEHYEFFGNIKMLRDPKGNLLKDRSYFTITARLNEKFLGILLKVENDEALIIGATPLEFFRQIASSDTPIADLVIAMAIDPKMFEKVEVVLNLGDRSYIPDQKSSKFEGFSPYI